MSYGYTIVGGNEQELSLFFTLNALLQSRTDIGEETTDDEDVNVYLASLRNSLVEGEPGLETPTSSYDLEIAHMADQADAGRAIGCIGSTRIGHSFPQQSSGDRGWIVVCGERCRVRRLSGCLQEGNTTIRSLHQSSESYGGVRSAE